MKAKFLKSLKVIAVVMIALFMVLAIGEATGYVKTISRIQSPTGWTFLRGSHTFVAPTDTAYFLFTPNQPKSQSWYDTTVARVKTFSIPLFTAAADGSVDSVNIAYEVWSTSDTTNWWGGATRSKSYRGLWNTYAIGTDSGAAGIVGRNFSIGTSQGGAMPFVMVVAIGKTPSGGKGNNIGNVAKVDIIQR